MDVDVTNHVAWLMRLRVRWSRDGSFLFSISRPTDRPDHTFRKGVRSYERVSFAKCDDDTDTLHTRDSTAGRSAYCADAQWTRFLLADAGRGCGFTVVLFKRE